MKNHGGMLTIGIIFTIGGIYAALGGFGGFMSSNNMQDRDGFTGLIVIGIVLLAIGVILLIMRIVINNQQELKPQAYQQPRRKTPSVHIATHNFCQT